MTVVRAGLAVLAGAGCTALAGCGDGFGVLCTAEMRRSVAVEVRHASTGAPAARGVTGVGEHESGIVTEFAAVDDLRLHGDWSRELAGGHTIVLRKPGFVDAVLHVSVGSDECHVEPETIRAEIGPDAGAVLVAPISFAEGPEIDAYPASAGIRGEVFTAA